VLEFRRASNEFKMQIEEELRAADVADRQKQIAARRSPQRRAPEPTSEALTIRPPSNGTHGEHGKPVLAGDPGA
jgi:hypothetical protein